MCHVMSGDFKVVAMKHTGSFEDYAELVPQAAQQFLKKMPNFSGTEVTVYEPKTSEAHTKGVFYVGVLVDEKPESLPEEMEYLEIQQTYGMITGKANEIGRLYSTIDEWISQQGHKKELAGTYIVETYHPVENDVELVEIFMPLHA